MIIPFSNKIVSFFTISYWDMQYLRWGWQQKVQKKYRLFDMDGDNIKLLPTAPYSLKYSKLKIDLKLKKFSKGSLDISYNWTPSEEQAKNLDTIIKRHTEYNYPAWLIVMKTWRWKSHMIAQTVSYYAQKTIISVHNKKTLIEMEEKLTQFLDGNFKVWVFYGDRKIMWDIIITTHTSLNKQKWILKIKWETFKPKVLLYDEADRNLSPSMIKTFCNMQSIQAMYWLTWTPEAKNLTHSDLDKIFWKTIESDKWWYNVIPVIKYIRFKTTQDYLFTNWQEYRECLLEDEYRFEEQIKYIKHVMEYRKVWLLLSDRRIEVEKYFESLKDEDYEVILIHWDTKVSDDNEAINNSVYKWKKTLIIWSSWKMSRWVDIPAIDTVFLFYPNKFESATIQAVGRWLRTFEGKENTLLVDWADFSWMGKWQMYSRWKTYHKEYWIKIWPSNEAVSLD